MVATSLVLALGASLLSGCAGWNTSVMGPPAAIPMPNFVGLDVQTAEILLVNLDLRPEITFEGGLVGVQDPAPNTQVAPGSVVTLGPAETPEPTDTPAP